MPRGLSGTSEVGRERAKQEDQHLVTDVGFNKRDSFPDELGNSGQSARLQIARQLYK